MGTVLLVLVIVLVVAGLVYGVVSLLSNDDPGLVPVDPDGRARPLPNTRSLTEFDLQAVRFDVGLRGYRMAQVDRVLRRTAYDIGYKDEMIAVLEAEVIALREGRAEDAELLRKAREAAASIAPAPTEPARAGGAHRAGAPAAEPAALPAEGVADRATGVAEGETEAAATAVAGEAPAGDVDEETHAATAPGRLNRSALHRDDEPAGDDVEAPPQIDSEQGGVDAAVARDGGVERGSDRGSDAAQDADEPAKRGARG